MHVPLPPLALSLFRRKTSQTIPCVCAYACGSPCVRLPSYVIAVQVLNVNEPPTCLRETGLRLVAEKSNSSTTLPPAVQCIDPEGMGLSYSIRPGSSPYFGISPTGMLFAVIQVPTIPTEEQNETVLVAVTDGARVVNRTMIVSIQHLNLPPVFINPTALRGVRENLLRGTVISPPANASHLLGVTYSLFSVPRYSVDNSPLFTISPTTGVLTVAGPAPPVSFLDHEATGTYVAACSSPVLLLNPPPPPRRHSPESCLAPVRVLLSYVSVVQGLRQASVLMLLHLPSLLGGEGLSLV